MLIAAGANVNARAHALNTSDQSGTPLHEAGKAGNEKTIRMLLEAGANPKAKDLWGKTYEYYLKRTKKIASRQRTAKKILDEAFALALRTRNARKKSLAANTKTTRNSRARGN